MSARTQELAAQTHDLSVRNHELTRTGQVTDRYTKAIEQLGSETRDVRLGGIYALERIMRDSPEDQATIVEVLSAFVREHAAWNPAQEKANDPTAEIRPSVDVQAALTVIGRRQQVPQDPFFQGLQSIDLRCSDLRGAELHNAHLEGALLWEAHLVFALLWEAVLWEALLEEANLRGALLYGARLWDADLQDANLSRALLSHSQLRREQIAVVRNADQIVWLDDKERTQQAVVDLTDSAPAGQDEPQNDVEQPTSDKPEPPLP